MSLWKKNTVSLDEVNKFTVGNDRNFDMYLAPFDVLGSMAHIKMLNSVGLLLDDETKKLTAELKNIYKNIEDGKFVIEDDVEDVHSQIEFLLTKTLGEAGKKIHSARSRNDQVLVDVKMFLRSELEELVYAVKNLFSLLQEKSNEYKDYGLPGYTHLQIAMPSSFGLWFGAYAESLVDDLLTVKAAYDVVNKNPLGSAAGYGSSFPINRSMTTDLLGFESLNYNVVYAQMGRGKAERIVASALANVADTLAKLSMDACLYMNQDFAFISFPPELTTGSSIMPHKKNPDVFELVRSHCNKIKALPNEIMLMTTNLPSGYHRDLQLLKENLFPAFTDLRNCINMISLMLTNIKIEKDILKKEKYKLLYTVEAVNSLVLQGTAFRDAYQKIGKQVEEGNFILDEKNLVAYTHEGSIGNLCNEEIKKQMETLLAKFPFEKINLAYKKMVG